MSEVIIRELERKDIGNGFLTTLDTLRQTTSNIKKDKALEIFENINSNQNHIILVAQIDGKIIGAATLIIEPKFIHNGSLAGHIEDVVVQEKFQGQGIGEKLTSHLLEIAKKRGCYKTVLNCTDELKPFYEKLGFKQNSNELRLNHI